MSLLICHKCGAQLTPGDGRALRSGSNELWLSAISTWEFLILVEKGRVKLDAGVDDWLSEAFGRAPMLEAPVTHEIARASRSVELPHKDPVDRFLAATATVLDLTLITADERLMQLKSCTVLPNRLSGSTPSASGVDPL